METAMDSISFMVRHLAPGNLLSALKWILIELRFPASSKGYRCMLIAIPLYRSDRDQSLTKEIYPAAAKQLGYRSWKRVEKQIRDAITAAWNRRDSDAWERYFPGGEKPSNGEFIATISEILDLWENCTSENRKDKSKISG